MFSHEPIIYPRVDTVRESLFLNAWKKYLVEKIPYARDEQTYFDKIFPKRLFNQERASQVAASFMVFMGCNAGLSFTYMAKKMYENNQNIPRSDAFLATWSIENKREFGINSGIRYVEAILTPRHVFEDEKHRHIYFSKHITVEDYEMVEEMVKWWGSFDAENIQREVQEEFDKIQKENLIFT